MHKTAKRQKQITAKDKLNAKKMAQVANPQPVQCRFSSQGVVQREQGGNTETVTSNQTGMPNQLKSGLENLSGYDLSPVRVHYNSPKPQQLGALAYTQGTNIHVGPGQERHLPHEGWHVVQQMQGRVKPTLQLKGFGINDDERLEREADLKGNSAACSKSITNGAVNHNKIHTTDHAISTQLFSNREDHKIVQLLSETDEENRIKFWQIYRYRPGGLTEAIEFLFETYNIGNLDSFDLAIDTGHERFHAMTEFGYDRKGRFRKPRLTISSRYIWRMYDHQFERILRTLRHEMKHVRDRYNRDFMQHASNDEMEFRAYHEEIFNNSGNMPEHSLENKKIRARRALEHLANVSHDKQREYSMDERIDLEVLLREE